MAAKSKAPRRIAFEFVLDLLSPLPIRTTPFFSSTAIYLGDKIMMALREKGKDTDDGVWLATTKEHHASLAKELPSMRHIKVFGTRETGWQVLPSNAKTFERDVTRACELVVAGDERIGKVPASKKPKTAGNKPKTKRTTSSRRG